MADAAVSLAMPDEFAQRGRWRAFRDPSVEAAYSAWHRDQIIPTARVIAIGSAVVWALVPVLTELFVGETPRVLIVSCWVIAVPTLLAVLLASFTALRHWASEFIVVAIVVIGLAMIWAMSSIYGPASGAVACGAFLVLFYPLIVRIPTGAAAISTTTLTTAPVALAIGGIRDGEASLFVTWPYVATLVVSAPLVVLAAALIEATMRQQFAAQRQLQATQRLLRRYAPAAVADRIESGDAKAVGQPQRLRVTALSSDLAGFTALADQIDPESLSQIINEYMATMSDVVERQGGVVTEFAGDGLMAIFGAPEALEPDEQVLRALSAAKAMHAGLDELNKTWFRLGIEQPLRVRIGINTGMLSVGTFGSDGRATYTAIGLQMNVAARIQAQSEPGGILLSSASWHLVQDTVECDPLGEVTVKGVHFPISIYSPRA
jgi:class 3 adenylate cyclase